MRKSTLNLWLASPDDLINQEAAAACQQMLCDDERARWLRFKFEKHRREFLATHALARLALSHHSPHPPHSWRFKMNAFGKPSIDPGCELRFNLSNAPKLVACLVSDNSDVGVDIEPYSRAASVLEVAPRMFSKKELIQLESLDSKLRPLRALRLWTLKEAYVKARGMGLSLPTTSFSFLFDNEDSIRMEIEQEHGGPIDRWAYCLIDRAEHCIALMVQAVEHPVLQVWRSQLPSTTEPTATIINPRWFH